MTPDISAKDIRDEFAFLDDWEDRYEHIIDLGKANPVLSEAERSEENRVKGCASQVWILTTTDDNGRLQIRAMSDAIIVSGLIALIVRIYSGTHPKDILAFDAAALFDEIGVSGALTAQRSNGLASMLQRIRSDATAIMDDQADAAGTTVS